MTESPVDVWIKQAIPAGSGRYYALLHSKNKTQLSATITLLSIWSKLSFSKKEIDAAKKQIEWWRAELDNNAPKHPVTQQLYSALTEASSRHRVTGQLQEVLNGYSALVTEGSPSREAANSRFHHSTGVVAAKALSNTVESQHTHSIEQVGIALSKLRCVRHLRKHVANGLLCLPFEEISASNLSPKDLSGGNYTPEVVTFLHSHLDSIRLQLDSAIPQLPVESPDADFLFIYANLQYKLLQHIRRDTESLEQPDLRLSPIRYFWAARGAARKLHKLRSD